MPENPRHPNLSLTNQTFVCCVKIIHYKQGFFELYEKIQVVLKIFLKKSKN
ncbi:hypothetical protein [uncultured Gammaproteobacteria bacterium]|nr:hypothetical protein [uncultured Gammaproteobacteria bacterium]